MQTNNCGTSVAAGANCTLNVSFIPTTTGNRFGMLVVSDNATNNSQSATLSGSGLAPTVVFAPTGMSFPSLAVGTTSAPKTLKLTNNTGQTLTITAIAASRNFSKTNNFATIV